MNFSLELFPPKTDAGMERLKETVLALNVLGPEYISVTYGAGGSTQGPTFSTVDWLVEQGIETAPHLSCIGSTRAEIQQILTRYKERTIRRLVALRGDLPSGAGLGALGELHFASELVAYVREAFSDHFHIEVAAYPEFHPQARSAQADLENFARKVRAGADGAITQYFYNADAYFRFMDDCHGLGLDIPVVPGIMPITNQAQLLRFSDACGAEIPRWIRRRLEGLGDDMEEIRLFGLDIVTRLCEQLLAGGAPGLHFYTMNQAGPTRDILHRLGTG
jgi:methylenetetrahydrofolate reductase (NADPH)